MRKQCNFVKCPCPFKNKRNNTKKCLYCSGNHVERDKIIENWRSLWDKQGGDKDFENLLIEIWGETKEKEENNKKKNKNWKRGFLWVHLIGIVFILGWTVCFILSPINICSKTFVVKWPDFLAGAAFLSIMTIWASAVVSKYVDIKKYQETWVRHSTHRQKLEREMLLYTQALEPYTLHCINRKETFTENVIAILSGNQDKFANNMETKEKTLMDIVNYIQLKMQGK